MTGHNQIFKVKFHVEYAFAFLRCIVKVKFHLFDIFYDVL